MYEVESQARDHLGGTKSRAPTGTTNPDLHRGGHCSGHCDWKGPCDMYNYCNPKTNDCTDCGCDGDYWGYPACDTPCNPDYHCEGGGCNETTGLCNDGCATNWANFPKCDVACSGHCDWKGPCSMYTHCNPNTPTGDCTDCGCDGDYWGYPACDTPCNPDYHCEGGSCNEKTGLCDECADGWANFPECDVACSGHCDWKGPCDMYTHCNPNTPTGDCTDCGCDGDYWGYPACDTPCNPDYHCEGGSCNEKTGLCDECADGWANFPKCDVACSGHCDWKGPCDMYTHCNPNTPTGDCTDCGCSGGYWGYPACQYQCSPSCAGSCDRNDGSCSSCLPPMTGQYCQLNDQAIDHCAELLEGFLSKALRLESRLSCALLGPAVGDACFSGVVALLGLTEGMAAFYAADILEMCASFVTRIETLCYRFGPTILKMATDEISKLACKGLMDIVSQLGHQHLLAAQGPRLAASTPEDWRNPPLHNLTQPRFPPCFMASITLSTQSRSCDASGPSRCPAQSWDPLPMSEEVVWFHTNRTRRVSYYTSAHGEGDADPVTKVAMQTFNCAPLVEEPRGYAYTTLSNGTRVEYGHSVRCLVGPDFLRQTVATTLNTTLDFDFTYEGNGSNADTLTWSAQFTNSSAVYTERLVCPSGNGSAILQGTRQGKEGVGSDSSCMRSPVSLVLHRPTFSVALAFANTTSLPCPTEDPRRRV